MLSLLGGVRRSGAHEGGEGRGHIVSPRAQLVIDSASNTLTLTDG